MRAVVCIKSVISKNPEGAPVRSLDLCELNPFDRPALELALMLADAHGGEVVALTMGPELTAGDALFEAMAMGAHSAALVCDASLAGSDTLVTSAVLAAAIKKLGPFDLVVFGTRTMDSDTGHVGPQTATLLNLPLITWATSVELEDGNILVERKADGFKEKYRASLPAALTVHPGALIPRDVAFAGIERAYGQAAYQTLALADLGLQPGQVGWKGSPTQVGELKTVAREHKCEIIKGTVDEQADEIVARLKQKGLV